MTEDQQRTPSTFVKSIQCEMTATLFDDQLSPSRTPLQEHIYRLTAACMDVISAGDVVFQDAGALEAFQERLPDLVQAITKALLDIIAVETTDHEAERRRRNDT